MLELLVLLVMLVVVSMMSMVTVVAVTLSVDNHSRLSHCHTLGALSMGHHRLHTRLHRVSRLHHTRLHTGLHHARLHTWLHRRVARLARRHHSLWVHTWLHTRLARRHHSRLHARLHWRVAGLTRWHHARLHAWLHLRVLTRRHHAWLHAWLHGVLARRHHARLHTGLHHTWLHTGRHHARLHHSWLHLWLGSFVATSSFPDRLEMNLASRFALVCDLEPLIDAIADTKSRELESSFTDLIICTRILVVNDQCHIVANILNVDIECLVPDRCLASTILGLGSKLLLARLNLHIRIHFAERLRVTS